MNILHISPYALRGGCEKDCFLFIQASPQFEQSVVVLGKEGPMTGAWNSLGTPVVHLDLLGKSFIKMKWELDRFLYGKKYDMVIYWSTIRIATVLGSLRKVTDKVRVHIGNPLQYSGVQLQREIFLDKIWKRSPEVIFLPCSDYAGSSFKKAPYFKDFPIITSLNPIEMAPSKRKSPFMGRKNINVGMVARLDPIKNHALLIKAFKQVSLRFPNMILHIVGNGVLKNYLHELTQSLGLVEKVIFYGDVDKVYEHLEFWDAFIYSTTKREGLGSAVIEAMANGLPCLLPDLPMMRELAPEEVKVKWFTPDSESSLVNEWISLFENPGQFPEMSESVFNRSLNFNSERYVKEYIA